MSTYWRERATAPGFSHRFPVTRVGNSVRTAPAPSPFATPAPERTRSRSPLAGQSHAWDLGDILYHRGERVAKRRLDVRRPDKLGDMRNRNADWRPDRRKFPPGDLGLRCWRHGILTFAATQGHGYVCDMHDLTNVAAVFNQTGALSTTSATFTEAGTSAATTDVVVWKCMGF